MKKWVSILFLYVITLYAGTQAYAIDLPATVHKIKNFSLASHLSYNRWSCEKDPVKAVQSGFDTQNHEKCWARALEQAQNLQKPNPDFHKIFDMYPKPLQNKIIYFLKIKLGLAKGNLENLKEDMQKYVLDHEPYPSKHTKTIQSPFLQKPEVQASPNYRFPIPTSTISQKQFNSDSIQNLKLKSPQPEPQPQTSINRAERNLNTKLKQNEKVPLSKKNSMGILNQNDSIPSLRDTSAAHTSHALTIHTPLQLQQLWKEANTINKDTKYIGEVKEVNSNKGALIVVADSHTSAKQLNNQLVYLPAAVAQKLKEGEFVSLPKIIPTSQDMGPVLGTSGINLQAKGAILALPAPAESDRSKKENISLKHPERAVPSTPLLITRPKLPLALEYHPQEASPPVSSLSPIISPSAAPLAEPSRLKEKPGRKSASFTASLRGTVLDRGEFTTAPIIPLQPQIPVQKSNEESRTSLHIHAPVLETPRISRRSSKESKDNQLVLSPQSTPAFVGYDVKKCVETSSSLSDSILLTLEGDPKSLNGTTPDWKAACAHTIIERFGDRFQTSFLNEAHMEFAQLSEKASGLLRQYLEAVAQKNPLSNQLKTVAWDVVHNKLESYKQHSKEDVKEYSEEPVPTIPVTSIVSNNETDQVSLHQDASALEIMEKPSHLKKDPFQKISEICESSTFEDILIDSLKGVHSCAHKALLFIQDPTSSFSSTLSLYSETAQSAVKQVLRDLSQKKKPDIFSEKTVERIINGELKPRGQKAIKAIDPQAADEPQPEPSPQPKCTDGILSALRIIAAASSSNSRSCIKIFNDLTQSAPHQHELEKEYPLKKEFFALPLLLQNKVEKFISSPKDPINSYTLFYSEIIEALQKAKMSYVWPIYEKEIEEDPDDKDLRLTEATCSHNLETAIDAIFHYKNRTHCLVDTRTILENYQDIQPNDPIAKDYGLLGPVLQQNILDFIHKGYKFWKLDKFIAFKKEIESALKQAKGRLSLNTQCSSNLEEVIHEILQKTPPLPSCLERMLYDINHPHLASEALEQYQALPIAVQSAVRLLLTKPDEVSAHQVFASTMKQVHAEAQGQLSPEIQIKKKKWSKSCSNDLSELIQTILKGDLSQDCLERAVFYIDHPQTKIVEDFYREDKDPENEEWYNSIFEQYVALPFHIQAVLKDVLEAPRDNQKKTQFIEALKHYKIEETEKE
jgi:hypothetical protein